MGQTVGTIRVVQDGVTPFTNARRIPPILKDQIMTLMGKLLESEIRLEVPDRQGEIYPLSTAAEAFNLLQRGQNVYTDNGRFYLSIKGPLDLLFMNHESNVISRVEFS